MRGFFSFFFLIFFLLDVFSMTVSGVEETSYAKQVIGRIELPTNN